jgi:hypothetical protein
LRPKEADRVRPDDLRWPRKQAASSKDITQTLTELAERTHSDRTLPYEAYLQRLHTLRLVAEALGAELPGTAWAVRVPRRGKPKGE